MPKVIGSIRQQIRIINTFTAMKKPTVREENTFRLEPKKEERFKHQLVEEKTREVLEKYLHGMEYSAQMCGSLSCQISNEVKNAIKTFCPRHKLVCHITLGENTKQNVRLVSRCLWDDTNDSMTTVEYYTNTLFAVVTVYSVYQE